MAFHLQCQCFVYTFLTTLPNSAARWDPLHSDGWRFDTHLPLAFAPFLACVQGLLPSDVDPLLVLHWYSGNALPKIAIVAKRLELYEVVPRVPVHCVSKFKWLHLLLLKHFEVVLGVGALLRVSGPIPPHTKRLLVTGTLVL